MTVKKIVENYLKENGYNGLVGSTECGCRVEGDDLMPCRDYAGMANCEPHKFETTLEEWQTLQEDL